MFNHNDVYLAIFYTYLFGIFFGFLFNFIRYTIFGFVERKSA